MNNTELIARSKKVAAELDDFNASLDRKAAKCIRELLEALQLAQPVAPLNLAREVLKLNTLWNKSTVHDPSIADQLGVCRVLAERANTDD